MSLVFKPRPEGKKEAATTSNRELTIRLHRRFMGPGGSLVGGRVIEVVYYIYPEELGPLGERVRRLKEEIDRLKEEPLEVLRRKLGLKENEFIDIDEAGHILICRRTFVDGEEEEECRETPRSLAKEYDKIWKKYQKKINKLQEELRMELERISRELYDLVPRVIEVKVQVPGKSRIF